MAVAKMAAEKEASVATAGGKAAAAAEDAELLRVRLESVPAEVRADLEGEFEERERLAREEAGKSVRVR